MGKQITGSKSLVTQGMKYSELIKLYPNPMEYIKMYNKSIKLKPAWNNKTLTQILTSSDIADQLRSAMNEIGFWSVGHDYSPSSYLWCAGSYNHRKVRGREEYSVHAWGLAVDINPHLAPFHKPSHQPNYIVKIMKKHGFLWGGNYKIKYMDGMHFTWIREGE